MLDLDPESLSDRDMLPRGWQFFLLGGDTRRSALRADGFPGFGVPMPDVGLPRLLVAGRTVEFRADIPIGSSIERASFVKSVSRKAGPSGPMAVVTICHELRPQADASPALAETQTYILLEGRPAAAENEHPAEGTLGEARKTVVPDATLLFQYSALGFNSHKIHLDRGYAREVEGHPDLVVNGGLTTLLLTEMLRTDLCQSPVRIKVRFTAPLFCNRQITLAATRDGERWRLKAFNDKGTMAADMEVDVR